MISRYDGNRCYLEGLIDIDEKPGPDTPKDTICVHAEASLHWDRERHSFVVEWKVSCDTDGLWAHAGHGSEFVDDYAKACGLAEVVIGQAVKSAKRKLRAAMEAS